MELDRYSRKLVENSLDCSREGADDLEEVSSVEVLYTQSCTRCYREHTVLEKVDAADSQGV